MSGESSNREPGGAFSLQQAQREHILAAIVLLLGPDTDYAKRLRAAQRLARAGAGVLPLLLQALHTHPEIVTPLWPWWPPQYEQIGRLLIQLSQSARLSLADLLHAPYLPQPPGPVLWTSVIEAMGQLPHAEYEPQLRESLEAPWWTVRYAAAMAIANRAVYISLHPATREALYHCQHNDPAIYVRLVAACALLRCADSSGLEVLSATLETPATATVRRAALFILATELPVPMEPARKNHLAELLLHCLEDEDQQIALYAARALRHTSSRHTLPELARLLGAERTHTRLAALLALEEMASRKTLRYALQQQQFPKRIAPLLSAPEAEIRRQASYTLATIGGEYAAAMLGLSIMNNLHPAHLEAIEALRLLPDIQRPPILTRVMRWLQHALTQPIDQIQVRALDSLSSLIWQAHARHQHAQLKLIFQELQQGGCLFQLLASANAGVRRRIVELLALLDPQLTAQRTTLVEILHHDLDSSVRGCLAHTLGQTAALWAVPDLI
ncbi:MAG TPA: HEAT repeat domain-containing protein, partial [Ktedonobacteraceae bacterium]|nr:HEAT repeat domain-containing protein [Ktedonobacteraceae bacterium]